VSGFDHSCRLATGGTVVCWGANDQGQLGDGTNELRPEPVAVAGGLSFSALSAGHKRTCGLVDGRAHCWGMQTARTSPASRPAPVPRADQDRR
jgi:alpha-tubulin suppressor-like RCC1 family protein